ncbi:MAG: DUF4345 domain-containing protein [Proteobacteria bacterium]|nr:MAG: DUF4345 domain-containing protein [Pseudomonadota bacterium]
MRPTLVATVSKRIGLIVGITGATVAAFGLYGFFRPELIGQPEGFLLAAAAPAPELRAYYGDFELGFGLFLLLAAYRPKLCEAGALAAACTLGVIALGRLNQMWQGGFINSILLLSCAAEICFAAANFWAYRAARRSA